MEWRVIFCTELSSAERDEPKEREERSDPVCLLNLRRREGSKLILPHGVSPPSHLSPREGRLLSKSECQVYYCGLGFSDLGYYYAHPSRHTSTKTVICWRRESCTCPLEAPDSTLLLPLRSTLENCRCRLRIEIDGGSRIFVRRFRGLKRGTEREAPSGAAGRKGRGTADERRRQWPQFAI